jgi:two-component system sensor histidine kinase UhpB
MRRRTLLTQVLAVNALLVGLTAAVAALVAHNRAAHEAGASALLLIGLAVAGAILLNSVLLRRRLRPIDELVQAMDRVDLSRPGMRAEARDDSPQEICALTRSFNRMLERVELERRDAGLAVLQAQEIERQRVAQDLHDEVNQALTAVLLRLSATMGCAPEPIRLELEETRDLAQRAMHELLTLARQLRPTALDDHGLIAALASQVREFGDRTGIDARFGRHGTLPELSNAEQLVIYRVTQESLSNAAQHAGARRVDVELSFVGKTVLRVADDGDGFQGGQGVGAGNGRVRGRPGGLGLSGMRERALLVGGQLTVFSRPGEGTTVELTMGAR